MNTPNIRRRMILLLLAVFLSCTILEEVQAGPIQTTSKTTVSSKSKRRAARRRTRRRTSAEKPVYKITAPTICCAQDEPAPPVTISNRNTGASSTSSDAKTLSGGILNGKAISKPAPVYPPIAKAARASGMVVVQITIDENGDVFSARAVSGHPLLQQAAVNAVRQWKFSPTLLSGQPVKVAGLITVNFNLQ